MKPPTLVSPHARIHADLPWFVAGTLDARAAAETEAHLADCDECRAECAWLRRLAVGIAREDEVELAPQSSWNKLLDRIETHESRFSGLRSLKDWFAGRTERSLIAVIGVQSMIVLGLAAALLSLIRDEVPPQNEYQTLTDPRELPPGGSVRIVFADALTLAEVQRLIQTVGGSITAGPSEQGLYTVTLEGRGPTGSAATAAAWLRSQPGVMYAEALVAEDAQNSGPR